MILPLKSTINSSEPETQWHHSHIFIMGEGEIFLAYKNNMRIFLESFIFHQFQSTITEVQFTACVILQNVSSFPEAVIKTMRDFLLCLKE